MLKQVCVHTGKRHRFFVMEEGSVSNFIEEVKKVKTDDLYPTGAVEDFDLSKRFNSPHFKLRFSVELGYSILSYGLSSTDGLGIPGFLEPHSDCREAVNKMGVKEFFYQAEIDFLAGTTDPKKFDFTGEVYGTFLDEETFERIKDTLEKHGVPLDIAQELILKKSLREKTCSLQSQ
ncbi:hypothetical protein CF8_0166 [Aeromonas phage CF8]|nr:hypothetical protein CF8_0166 [Aeromonas phage CF8]